jgi:hypothetical protein
MLRLDRNLKRLILIEITAFRDAIERVEAEMASKRILDHVALAAVCSGRPSPEPRKGWARLASVTHAFVACGS